MKINYSISQIQALTPEQIIKIISSLQSTIADSESTQEALKCSIRARDDLIDRFRGQVLELEEKLSQGSRSDLFIESDEKAVESKGLKEKLETAEKSNEALKRGICERDAMINTFRRQIGELDGRLYSVEEQLAASELARERLKTSVCERDSLINSFRDQISELDRHVYVVEEKLSAAEKCEEQLKRTIRGRDSLIQDLQERTRGLDAELIQMGGLQEKITAMNIENIDLKSQIDRSGREIEALKRSIRSRDSLINNFRERNVELEGQIMQVNNGKLETVVESSKRARDLKVFGVDMLNIH